MNTQHDDDPLRGEALIPEPERTPHPQDGLVVAGPHPQNPFFMPDGWLEDLTSETPAMQEVLRRIRRVAPTRTTILLLGETGVGKGTLARLIHRLSNRADRPFVTVHCGAVPETLLESELFGHEKGAFTGATRQKPGKFEIAHTGTIFLDEVGTLTPAAQIKLLDVLHSHSFQRVGGERDIATDVRVIAATNEDLEAACKLGTFRKDLFYRINVFPLQVPSLRDRLPDIPHMAQTILRRLQLGYAEPIERIDDDVLDALMRYDWPGNVRELENLLERAVILETSDSLTRASFPAELFAEHPLAPPQPLDTALPLEAVRRRCVEDVERAYLKELLKENAGRIDHTAARAGITPRQLHKLMKKYGLRKETFK
ncbi:MAG: sigma-54 interaction domain-containing protein [Desulfovibrionaceae bacterium]